jgi:oligopeptide/dipeptide ABC transporter, ATP-binding protein, C-terminal domain
VSSRVMERNGSGPPPSSGAEAGALLDVRDLRVEYLTPGGSVRAVDGVSFSIAPGEVFGLAGESGCGKSTVAQAILRILRPPAIITGGEVLFKGKDILAMDGGELESVRWREISMVFQGALNALNPVMRVSTQIIDVLKRHKNLSTTEARQRAAELLELVEIDVRRLDAYPHELSGGMRQRVMIAIALALNPELLIMDEPTTALDVVVQKSIMEQIRSLKERLGFSVMLISHDLALMSEFADRIAVMYAGRIVELASAEGIFHNPLHPYTEGLLRSFPPLRGERRKLTGIPGAPPNMAEPPRGCRFHPRCTACNPVETEVEPVLQEVLPGHWLAVHKGMPALARLGLRMPASEETNL